jgi:hypothetical protein
LKKLQKIIEARRAQSHVTLLRENPESVEHLDIRDRRILRTTNSQEITHGSGTESKSILNQTYCGHRTGSSHFLSTSPQLKQDK